MNRRCFCKHLAGIAGLAALSGCVGPTAGAFLQVDERLCIGCSECVKVCEADAIAVLNTKAWIDPAKCIQCGKCVKVCPYEAII